MIPFNGIVSQIATGIQSSVFLDSTGSVYAFGQNTRGQCGNNMAIQFFPSPVSVKYVGSISKVSSGGSHVALLATNGTVMTFGSNSVFFNFNH